jgi:hypothetical protein
MDYQRVANIINKIARDYTGLGLAPRVEVVTVNDKLGSYIQKYKLVMNEDMYDLAEYKGIIQDMFYSDEAPFVVGDHDFYLEPYSNRMDWVLAEY